MKYQDYEITQDYLPIRTGKVGRRSGQKLLKVGFIVAHDTGNPNSTAKGNVKYYRNSYNDQSASAHIFVDDKDIIICIPLDEKAWHVLYGKPLDNEVYGDDANDIAIGVELCYFPNDKERTIKAYQKYLWIINQIIIKYNLDPNVCVIGHEILDPQRKTDPTNALRTFGWTYEKLLRDVVDYNKGYSIWKQNQNSSQNDQKNFLTSDILSDIMKRGFNLIDKLFTNKNKLDSVEVKLEDKLNDEKGDEWNLTREQIKEVQKMFNFLNYPAGVEDGIIGAKFRACTQAFQIDYQKEYGLKVDSVYGKYTDSALRDVYNKKLNEQNSESDNEEGYKHEVIGSTHIVTIYNPLDLKLHCEQTTGKKVNLKNIMNASFVWWHDWSTTKRDSFPTSLLVYDGKIIHGSQPNGYSYQTKNPIPNGAKCSTFIIGMDGKCRVEMRNTFTNEEAKDIHLAVSGLTIYPEVKKDGFYPYVAWSSVAYETLRPTISYTEENYVVLTFKPNSTAERANQTINYLNTKEDYKIVKTVGVDAGGSGNFDVDGKNISRTSRYMYAFLTW